MTNANDRVDTTTNAEGSMRRLDGSTKLSRTSPCTVGRARTVASRSHHEPTPECSSHPSMSTTTHTHANDNSVNNNNKTSLTAIAPLNILIMQQLQNLQLLHLMYQYVDLKLVHSLLI